MQPIQNLFANTPVCLIFIFLTTTGFGFLESDFRDARKIQENREFPSRTSIDNPPFRRETIRQANQKDRVYENLYDRRSFRTGTNRQPSINGLERDSRSGLIRENRRSNDNRERFFQERSRSLQNDRTRVRSSELIRDLESAQRELRQAPEAGRSRQISLSNYRNSLDERSIRNGESRRHGEGLRNLESMRTGESRRQGDSRRYGEGLRNLEGTRSEESRRNRDSTRNMESKRNGEIRRNRKSLQFRSRAIRTFTTNTNRFAQEDQRRTSNRIEDQNSIRFTESRIRFADNSERERSIGNRQRTIDNSRANGRLQTNLNTRREEFRDLLSGEARVLNPEASRYLKKDVQASSNFNVCINLIQVLLGAYLVGHIVALSSKNRRFEFQNLLPFASVKTKVE